jgi:Uncharacterized membrane-anchored protein conserved in bacteria
MERRLAAILAADAVGYSRLMEEDEAGCADSLNDYAENRWIELENPLANLPVCVRRRIVLWADHDSFY